MPSAQTLDRLATASPDGFSFWVKANRKTTHEQQRSVAVEFLDNLQPLSARAKLGGVLLQFPQSFHRTAANRNYLQAASEDFSSVPLAVEFRHASWDNEATYEGLRERRIALVVPDVPVIPGLYRPDRPILTAPTGYLRLHSRDAAKWYAGPKDRYDYDYSDGELNHLAADWSDAGESTACVTVFFNNCHHGQAAKNAQRFQELARCLS